MDEDDVIVPASEEDSAVDTSIYEAKISELEAALAIKQAESDAKDLEIAAAKAANYDLLKQVPTDEPLTPATVDDEMPMTIDDLFVSNKDGN